MAEKGVFFWHLIVCSMTGNCTLSQVKCPGKEPHAVIENWFPVRSSWGILGFYFCSPVSKSVTLYFIYSARLQLIYFYSYLSGVTEAVLKGTKCCISRDAGSMAWCADFYFWNASHLCFIIMICRKWEGSLYGIFICILLFWFKFIFCCFLNIEPEVSILELVISSASKAKGCHLTHVQEAVDWRQHVMGDITPGMPFLWGIYFNFLGEMYLGGQEHFYLETHCTLAVPKGEDGEMELFVSTQNPMKTQVLLINLVPKRH